MKYLIILLFVLAASAMTGHLLFGDRSAEGIYSFGDKLRDLGGRFHKVIGMVAVLIIIIFILRVIYYAVIAQ